VPASAIALAQDVIVFDNGKILEQGTLEELRSAGGYVSNLLFGQSADFDAEQTNDAGEDKCSKLTPGAAKQEFAAAEENAIDLKRRSGDFSVYKYFSAACGHKLMAAYLLMNVLWMCGSQFGGTLIQTRKAGPY
jgi:ATP-binding cassette subfamily C (CFTR/MRP) protein 1